MIWVVGCCFAYLDGLLGVVVGFSCCVVVLYLIAVSLGFVLC